MVKKSKRKQTVVPFEKSSSPAHINVATFNDIVNAVEACADIDVILNVVTQLAESNSLASQAKVLQTNKGGLKKILSKNYEDSEKDVNEVCVLLMLHLLLEPEHLWLKKSLEWLTDAITKATLLPEKDSRRLIKTTCLQYLDKCSSSDDMVKGSIDRCFGWVCTFQWMFNLDKELSWVDDGELADGDACWESSVWPAGRDIGYGSLLRIMQAISPLLHRCAEVIAPVVSDFAEQTNADVMRYAECAGECMRIMSAFLKPRRGAAVPVVVSSASESGDAWDLVTDSILTDGCSILLSHTVGKDVLTSTALVVAGIQWMLRLRLWNQSTELFHSRCPNQKDLSSAEDWEWGDESPCAGLQLVSLLGLLRMSTGEVNSSSLMGGTAHGLFEKLVGLVGGEDPLTAEFARSVGISPIIVAAMTRIDNEGDSMISMLSKSAVFRACLSVFDSSAVMYRPVVSSGCDEDSGRVLSYLLQLRQHVEYNETDPFSPSVGFKMRDMQLLAHMIVLYLSQSINSSNIMGNNSDGNMMTSRSQTSGVLLGVLLDMTIFTCLESTSPVSRVYGLQTMETWLGRVDSEKLPVVAAQNDEEGISLRNHLLSVLGSVATMLTRAWSHPSKGVSHMVPAVYQRVIDLVGSVDAAVKSRDTLGLPDHTDFWEVFLSGALAQPVEHRSRYQALSILLPKIGGERLLQLNPQIVRSLVVSIRVRDVASAVASFLGTLLRSILSDAIRSLRSVRNMYVKEVAEVLCSPDPKMRTNAADYLCPEMMAIDSDFAPLVIDEIRNECANSRATAEEKLWGIVSVVLHARLLTKSGSDIVADAGPVEVGETYGNPDNPAKISYYPLSAQELEWVCLSNDIDLRLLGLTVLTASQRVLSPMQSLELQILRDTLPYSLKSPVADVRQRVLRVLRTLMTRLRESYRSSMRDLKKAYAHRHSQANPEFEIPNDDIMLINAVFAEPRAPESESKLANIAGDVLSCMEWLNLTIMANFYPGAPNDREIMALEMLRCVHSGITGNIGTGVANKSKSSHCTAPVDKVMESTLLSYFNTEQMASSLLNLLISSWDPTRTLAADLLLTLPKPLPGYENSEKVTSLWMWGCRLMGSAKQRESDSGALIVRVIMCIYCLQLKWKFVPIDEYDESIPLDVVCNYQTDGANKLRLVPPQDGLLKEDVIFDGAIESQDFIHVLSSLLDNRLKNLSGVFDALSGNVAEVKNSASMESIAVSSKSEDVSREISLQSIPAMPTHLCHGGILAIKYCMIDLHTSGTLIPTQVTGSVDHRKGSKKQSAAKEVPTPVKQVLNWRPTVKRILDLALSSLSTSLQIVAESPVDNFFAPVPIEGADKDHILQSDTKKTNTRGYASDSFMLNTNVFMESMEGEDAEGGEDSIGVRMQRAVVGAWLLVKESCALLAKLVQMSVSIASPDSDDSDAILLTTAEIKTIGNAVLDAISRLKHNGAISEAQSALQMICESIIGNGSVNTTLSNLPRVWLDSLVDKLKGDQQVFILRRSAGFAFSFLSLLRAEPKNCTPVMLPIAMTALFEYASKGSNEKQDEILAGDGWRSVVHALNIVRLIILDSTLGPDLHPYIPEATMIAVKGFKSPLWAIRNSSMMVFSAVVQRTVDNDKRESGGIRAATPSDFFQRFPSLFPFLLSELVEIVGADIQFDSKHWPVNVVISRMVSSPSNSTHPSLYPILLMLSKMRTQMDSTSADVSAKGDEVSALVSETCDIGLFVPVVQMCASQALSQVRVVSSKALSSLVPLQQVPFVVEKILLKVLASFSVSADSSNPSAPSAVAGLQCGLSSNLFHGMLLQVCELMNNLRKHLSGGSSEMGNNKVIFASIVQNVTQLVVPQLVKLQQAIIAVAVEAERQTSTSKATKLSSLLDLPFAPIILLTFERVVKLVYDVNPSHITTELLIRTCEMNIAVLIAAVTENSSHKAEADAIQYSRIPFTPLLWKECLTDLIDMSFFLALKRKNSGKRGAAPGNNESKTAEDGSEAESSKDATRAETSEKKKAPPVQPSVPVCVMLRLLNHPISEVREGVVLGCLNSLTKITYHPSKSDDAIRSDVAVFLELALPQGECGDEVGDDSVDFILSLLRRCLAEHEPPILEIATQLLASISKWVSFDSIPSVLTKESSIDAISSLLKIACGVHKPDSMLDFLDPTVHSSLGGGAVPVIDSVTPPPLLSVVSTTTAANSIEILGWIVRSFFDQTLTFVNTTSDFSTIKSEILRSKTMGYLCREQDCTIGRMQTDFHLLKAFGDGTTQGDSEGNPEKVKCHDGHVWAWLRLMELAGVGPDSGVDIRGAAARCLCSSGALLWSAVHGSSAAPIDNPLGVINSSKHGGQDNGGGDFGCRVWTLALQLMQDDDSDVRSWMNEGVSQAVSLLCRIEPEFRGWTQHRLSAPPCMSPPVYPSLPLSATGVSWFLPENYCCGHGETSAADPLHSSNFVCNLGMWESPIVQGLAMERLVLPLTLSISWSILQSPRILSGGEEIEVALEEITNTEEGSKVFTPEEIIPRLLSSLHSTTIASAGLYVILEKWLDTCGSVERFCQSSSQYGTDMSQKIFEADQSNLFEETTIFSRALSFSLAYNLFLLPCHWTIPICVDFVRRASNALSTIKQYIRRCRQQQDGDDAEGWIGGFSYHPEKFEALYNSLSGAAFMCVAMRDAKFMKKKRRILLEKKQEVEAEQSAAKAICTLVRTLGTIARSLCRDLQGCESVVEATGDISAEVSSTPATEEIPAEVETLEESTSSSVSVHPMLVALIVDMAGPTDSPLNSSCGEYDACTIL